MNTFLTSMLVDVLGPVAADSGLGETLDRARRHLAEQIEDDGLVRYHGRPDHLEPGLGAKITPDADDTALAWRIAGGDQRKLPEVLRTLDSYRDSNGLYRTWLASREQYVSIDPGKDPNTGDIVIQMHVIMFLAKTDPDAARMAWDGCGTVIESFSFLSALLLHQGLFGTAVLTTEIAFSIFRPHS